MSALKKTVYAIEQKRPDVWRRRRAWRRLIEKLDHRRLVFLDETWIKTNMARTHGRCLKGQRLYGFVPHGRWTTLTFIAGLRCDKIIAPFIIDGPMNGEIFLLYIRDVLCPSLKPGDIVVMDNLGSHKSAEIRAVLKAVGASLLFLPPYIRTSTRSSHPSPRSRRG